MDTKIKAASGRQMEFDAARGVAMIGVVFGHNCSLGRLSIFITPYLIAAFFLIAGYFCSADPVRCKKRIVMLFKEYFKYTFILFVLSFILPPPRQQSPGIKSCSALSTHDPNCTTVQTAPWTVIFFSWTTIPSGFWLPWPLSRRFLPFWSKRQLLFPINSFAGAF